MRTPGISPSKDERKARSRTQKSGAFLKTFLLLLGALIWASPVFAQFTTVSGTIVDPTGLPYAGATVSAVIIPPGGANLRDNGNPVVNPPAALANSAGTFTLILADNSVVTPSGSQWVITVNLAPGIPPPYGTGAQNFSTTLTISGASQNISAQLNALAPALRISTQAVQNGIIFVDGVTNATVQAALAKVPAGGAEVHVPPNSTATWGAGSTAIPANTRLIFDSAAATYVVPGPVTLGAQSHIICAAGQSVGLSGDNNATFPNTGTVLNFTGNLTGSQDAISATGSNNNDGVSVEGCYIKMGGSGRAAIHFSGINGSVVKNNVIADPGLYGYWLDGGSSSGSHSYGNYLIQDDVVHSGSEAYRLSTDPAGTGVGGDIDRTTLIDAEQHPRDVGGVSSSGEGCHLFVPSTAGTQQTIYNTDLINFISNGSANATYGCKLENAKVAAGQTMIGDTMFAPAELEDVFQSNTGTALSVVDTTALDIAHVWVKGGLIGPGYTAGNNISQSNVVDFYISNGLTTSSSNNPNLYDAVSFLNNLTTTPSCANGGLIFSSVTPRELSMQMTSDSIVHFYNCNATADQWQYDVGNFALTPAVDGNGSVGGGPGNKAWFNFKGYNYYHGGTLLISNIAPTIAAAGCGGTNSTISAPNGTASFEILIGSGGATAGGCTITMPAALTSWTCDANTASATSTTNYLVKQTGAISTTSVVIQNFSDAAVATAFAASDTVRVKCLPN